MEWRLLLYSFRVSTIEDWVAINLYKQLFINELKWRYLILQDNPQRLFSQWSCTISHKSFEILDNKILGITTISLIHKSNVILGGHKLFGHFFYWTICDRLSINNHLNGSLLELYFEFSNNQVLNSQFRLLTEILYYDHHNWKSFQR